MDRGGLSYMARSNASIFGVGEGGKGFSPTGAWHLVVCLVLGSPHVVRSVGS
jgi:hypothetical protein